MADASSPTGRESSYRPTRRDVVALAGTTVGSGLLAGCLAGGASEDGEEGTYTAEMAPVDEVTFDAVPEDVMIYSLLYADMAVAYGHGDAVNSLGFDAETGGATLDAYYERLDGVAFDREGLTQLNTGSGSVTIDEELFYELDSDLHLLDPCLVRTFSGWDGGDVEEVADRVAPWFGNTLSRRHAEPPTDCKDEYRYYTLWEIAANVADVFQAGDRYEELAAIRTELLDQVRAERPPAGERPTVASVIFMDGSFYPARIDTPGFANAHIRPLGATDAFAGESIGSGEAYDYEALAALDPDVILHRYGVASHYDVAAISETLADHPVGAQLTAVETDNVYSSGHPVQGPIMNLFQIEMTAKQLYPDAFGEWPGYELGEPYPKIPEEEQLFDRDRVAAIVSGEI